MPATRNIDGREVVTGGPLYANLPTDIATTPPTIAEYALAIEHAAHVALGDGRLF